MKNKVNRLCTFEGTPLGARPGCSMTSIFPILLPYLVGGTSCGSFVARCKISARRAESKAHALDRINFPRLLEAQGT